jgi:hypothetical protein
LRVGDVLFAISEAGLTLRASKAEDTLKVYPAERFTPELASAIKEHKAAIIRVMREEPEQIVHTFGSATASQEKRGG